MSDEKPEPPKPPGKPTTKTSTVPLKKETVRITLRARPETGAVPPPPASPTPAPKPPAPPAAPATQPLKPAPPAAPAPPAGAKTVPLTPAPPASSKPGAPVAQPTARLTPTANLTPSAPGAPPAAPGTKPLPKATVKLQPTQPVSSAPTGAIASAPLSTGRLDLEDDTSETGVMPFAVIALVLALAAFAIELITSQRVFEQDLKAKTPSWAVPNADFKKRVGTTGVLVEKLKTGEDWEINEAYSFPRTMETSVPIKTYEEFKKEKT